VVNFIDLINFFLGVDEKKVHYVVFAFMNMTNKENRQKKSKKLLDNIQKQNKTKNIVEKKAEIVKSSENILTNSTPVKNIFNDEAKAEDLKNKQEKKLFKKIEMKPEIKKLEPKKVDYNLIKMDIEMNFDIDDNVNFIDLEGVLNRLEELKNKYNDNNILELYYFDEKQNKFIWNDKLLNS